jgi:hypothetical protein
MSRAPFRQLHELDASIRLISHYDVGTDSTETRFDVLLGSEKGVNQFNFSITSSKPSDSPLHLENNRGVIDDFDVKVSSEDLIDTFRAFANALESHKARADLDRLAAFQITEPQWNAAVKDESSQERMWQAVRLAASS